MAGIRYSFEKSGKHIQTSAEYLDTRRFVDPNIRRLVRESVVARLKGAAPDVVMVSDNDALDFILACRGFLFPDTPVVFCGINHFNPSMIGKHRLITGVAEDVSVMESVAMALRLHPGTREIVVVGRTSVPADKANRSSFVDALPTLPPRIRVSFWDDLAASQLKSRLAVLGEGTIVFLNGLMSDEKGRQLMYDETTEFVSHYSRVPVYSLWEVYLGHGIVGGKLVSGHSQGQIAAELALRILKGEKADLIPVVDARSANRFMADYRQLARFGIPVSALPKGTELINQPESFYRNNKGLVWGTVIIIAMMSGLIVYLGGTIIHRRKMEEALRHANLVVENSPVVLFRWLAAPGWPVELVSANVSQFGYSQEELLSGAVPFSAMVHPEDLVRVSEEVAGYSAEGVDSFQQEYRIVAKSGKVHWVYDRTVVERDAAGKISNYQGIVMDITERRHAEETLRASEERFRSLVETSSDWIWEVDQRGVYTYASPKVRDILGYDPNEVIGRSPFDLMPPQEAERMRKQFADIVESCESFCGLENINLHKSGQFVFLETSGVPIFDAHGTLSGYRGIDRDITARKRAEEALRLNAERMDALLQLNQLAVSTRDEIMSFAFETAVGLTRSKLGYLGLMNEEETVMSVHFWSRDVMPECDVSDKTLDFPIETSGLWGEAVRQRRPIITNDYAAANLWKKGYPEGHIGIMRHMNLPIIADGRIVLVAGVGNKEDDYNEADVSHLALLMEGMWRLIERKQAEEDLRFTQYAVDTAFAQAFWLKPDGRVLYVNDAACRSLGYTREELLEMTIPDIDPSFTPEIFAEYWRELKGKGSITIETAQRAKDGRVYPVEVSSNYVVFDGREYNCSFVTDITERKLAEEALRESEEKFRVLAETAPAAIVLHQGGKFIYANPATTRLFGYSEEELLKMNFWDWANEDSRELVRELGLARLRGEPVPLQYEQKMFTKGGDERWAVISAGVIDYRGKPTVITTFLDITNLKKAEEKINEALAEKVVLLKEVHHRVKNNLQIISTLLDLQSEGIRDKEALEAFMDCQDRIKAMALIHERLYESTDMASIDFAGYVEGLSTYLFNTYLIDPGLIRLKVEAEGILLGIDRAIPCGLIVNELVSNALKHAFPDNRQGEIRIGFHGGEDGRITLRVEDNGIGLPAAMDITKTDTLGLQLVNLLARQMLGEVSLERENGTVFIVRFSDQSPK
jgi:PAS domain S-box-containing protein